MPVAAREADSSESKNDAVHAVAPGTAPGTALGRALRRAPGSVATIALLGNPNTGKTTLFNRLCGLRAKTANFPGSTVEARIGAIRTGGETLRLIDLPGTYGLHLNLPEASACRMCLAGEFPREAPEAVLVVVDATNLERNLVLVAETARLALPVAVALNMTDLAQRRGLRIDVEALEQALGCPVASIMARSGRGVPHLLDVMRAMSHGSAARSTSIPDTNDPAALTEWAHALARRVSVRADKEAGKGDRFTDRLDAVFTHPVLGLVVFAIVMTGIFFTIFSLAETPMVLIELFFAMLGDAVAALVPEGAIQDLLVNGIIAGVAGTIVFLPQICLLFFLISLIEDTGYLARAAFVVDRIMRKFGLPGQSFVPLLNAHACAIPAIMSTKLIPDRRDRIATILVAPFMSCSARLPVYVLLIGILFPHRPLAAGLAFAGCYALGAVAGLLTAALFRRTLLRGKSRPMVLELPSYKTPSLKTALVTTADRGWIFLRKAGTVILGISVVLWWLSTYPHSAPPAKALTLQTQAAQIAEVEPAQSSALRAEADVMIARAAVANSFVGRIGRAVEPVLAPIGADWQLSIGILTSFAAREVFVSTLAVIFTGSDDAEDETVIERVRSAQRDDGSPVFTLPAAAGLLVFYVLAMQCLPTLAVTAREAGGWKWALLQLAYMSALAYVLGTLAFNAMRWTGVS